MTMEEKKLNLDGCWIVNVPLVRNQGYSFAVYVDYHSCEEDIIDMCTENDMFDDDYDFMYANAEQMTEYDYEFWKDDIQILAMS